MVGNPSYKPTKDREHEIDEKEDINLMNLESGASSRTPLVRDTPMIKMGSYYNPNNPKTSFYGGNMSPSFRTPMYNYSQREFSEHQMEDMPAASPGPSQTPFVYNTSNTPLLNIQSQSPYYNAGQTSFHNTSLRPSSQIRSPSYLYQNSASSSPNYSSLQSRSPDYNSPLGSSGRLGNSPNYSPSPMDPHRGQFKTEENDYDEEDEV